MVCQIYSLGSELRCEECGKVLKPQCNLKRRNGKVYCVDCHWDLFGREEMKTKYPNINKMLNNEFTIED
jgi:predicted RNA-binding Zn-ribbon protein involved in translation (DUF1610 family)